MGWNSWDCFGPSVTEAEVRANAKFMAQQLKEFGWDYIVVDIQWYEPAARGGGYNPHAQLVLDEHGLPQPALNRFPSAAGGAGFKPLADFVHGLGLKLGVHIMRGIPRQAVEAKLPILGTEWTADQVADRTNVCAWCTDNHGLDHAHPGAQAYYDSLLAQFARWELDFVKADDMIGPFHAAEVSAFSRAVQNCGRPMVLSLSPGVDVTPALAEPLAAAAQMWRISNDLWDDWKQLLAQFERLAAWAPYARAGAWPDADMLPIGHVGIRAEVGADRTSNLSLEEQRTMLTLWCIARSPLMMGGDLPTTAPETIALLTNPEVLAVLNYSKGARQVLDEDGTIAWTAQGESGQTYVAVFNLSDAARTAGLPWQRLGVEAPKQVRDLWTRADRDAAPALTVDLPAHGSALLAVSQAE
jgi:alpha-galactosidase